MRVIKYFFEEPTLLDFPESASEKPLDRGETTVKLGATRQHFRGYLAASDLGSGTIGGSSLEDQVAAKALTSLIEGPGWFFSKGSGPHDSIQSQLLSNPEAIFNALVTMPAESLLVTDFNPKGQEINSLVHRSTDKKTFGAIVRLLDMGATVVLPEPAHVGHDWSIFSSNPLSGRMRDALEEAAATNCRSFVVPYVKARGEHKFYFEQYDLELFKEYEVK